MLPTPGHEVTGCTLGKCSGRESLPATLHERQLAKMGGTIARGETEATVVYTGLREFYTDERLVMFV